MLPRPQRHGAACRSAGKTYRIGPGDFFAKREGPENPHQFINDSDKELRVLTIGEHRHDVRRVPARAVAAGRPAAEGLTPAVSPGRPPGTASTERTSMRSRLRHPLTLLLVLLAAVRRSPACGGDDDDDEPTSTTAAAAPPAQATSVAEETSTSAESGEGSGTAGSPTTGRVEATDAGAAPPDQATSIAAGTASPEDEAAIRAAIQAYIDAFANRDGEKACDLMKPEVADAFLEAVQGQVSADTCADAFEQAAAQRRRPARRAVRSRRR